MHGHDPAQLTRDRLLDYFLQAAKPRSEWRVGMEVERLARDAATDLPLPYEGEGPSVRKVLEFYLAERPGAPIWEAHYLIGIDAPWGNITLEPGGQIEWSSRPYRSLDELNTALEGHLAVSARASAELGIRWVEAAVDPDHPVSQMPWMPKARYKIMRPYLGARGRLAHRMMTQTGSIQCAYDYADADDWVRKFRAAAFLAPLAVALFANSSRVDGADSGYRSYRQVIWRETDPDRCGLPPVVFQPDFDLGAWLDWILAVPTIFRHRGRGLVPAGGVPFATLMKLEGCDSLGPEDWETHVSTVFTEVRSYTYLEVRSADLQPGDLMLAVPALWTGLLYDDQALDIALELAAGFASYETWTAAMDTAARQGLDGPVAGGTYRELAAKALGAALGGLSRGAPCAGTGAAIQALERLAETRGLNIDPS